MGPCAYAHQMVCKMRKQKRNVTVISDGTGNHHQSTRGLRSKRKDINVCPVVSPWMKMRMGLAFFLKLKKNRRKVRSSWLLCCETRAGSHAFCGEFWAGNGANGPSSVLTKSRTAGCCGIPIYKELAQSPHRYTHRLIEGWCKLINPLIEMDTPHMGRAVREAWRSMRTGRARASWCARRPFGWNKFAFVERTI